uniref:Uncharacterized protein n=1 Tax=Triticum urartu TaxID=4572 RepID=A0A8R7UWT4_TRIUA
MWCKCTWRWLECQIHRRPVIDAHTGHHGTAAMETQIMLMSVSGMVTHLKHMYLQSKRFFVFAFFILLGLGSPNYVELEHDCLEISVPKYSLAATRNAEDKKLEHQAKTKLEFSAMKLSQRQTCVPIRKFPYCSKIDAEKQRGRRNYKVFRSKTKKGTRN